MRRTWPQRLLLMAGLAVSATCFLLAQLFWDAETILSQIGRIRVPANVLATPGTPGDPLTFLIVGVDSSDGLDENDPVRDGRDVDSEANGRFLSDTILLARLDPATGSIDLLSVPRDLYVTVPGSTEWRINSTLLIGGMPTLIETIDANLGIEINHFMVINFAGFSDIVDLVGGVPIFFPYETRDLGSGLLIEAPGCWVLDGSASLSYVRARSLEERIDGEWVPLRAPAPDLARIERQQEFMVIALEEALDLGGSDLGRVRSFVEAGAAAVQLDELLTPQDLIGLAQAFQEFDTDQLDAETLPVTPLFSGAGQYLGEELQALGAEEVLAPFIGLGDLDRPSSVAVQVLGIGGQVDRVSTELSERGFVSTSDESGGAQVQTRLRFHPDEVTKARLLARYLEVAPEVIEDLSLSETLRIELGADFAGVRTFPRPDSELDDVFIAAASHPSTTQGDAPGASTQVAPATTTADATDADGSQAPVIQDEAADNASSVDDVVPAVTTTAIVVENQGNSVDSAVSNGPTTTAVATTTIIRGRPPEGVPCNAHGE